MSASNIPFQTIDWSAVAKPEHPGTTGVAHWQTIPLGGLRIRLVEYSADYLADHWCEKGHIVHCLSGSFVSELQGGASTEYGPGLSYVVSDGLSSHRSSSEAGVRLLIIDGIFWG